MVIWKLLAASRPPPDRLEAIWSHPGSLRPPRLDQVLPDGWVIFPAPKIDATPGPAFAGGDFREDSEAAPRRLRGGREAAIASVAIGLVAAALVGALLARFTERSMIVTAARQVAVAALACGATYLIGSLLGTTAA